MTRRRAYADAKVKYSAPVRSEVEGDAAYVVVPVQYVFKEKGKAMLEDAQMTFVLHREAGAWKIAGWVWSGKKPYPPNSSHSVNDAQFE